VIADPEISTGTSVANACSHLDLLPTVLDLATAGTSTSGPNDGFGLNLPGRSLVPSAVGDTDDVDETTGDYMGEMTSHPMFMIRRGVYKYIHCPTDPPLLFDVEADP